MIKVTCTKGMVTVYPTTGLDLGIATIPLVADPRGVSHILAEGESIDVDENEHPAVGGKFRAGDSAFSVTNNAADDVKIVHWHEDADDDDTGLDYIDLTGQETDENYTEFVLHHDDTHDAEVTKSNVLTISVLG